MSVLHGCRSCTPFLRDLLGGPQRGENHVSLRFTPRDIARRVRVTVDGQAVQDRCFEALAGVDGWAACYPMPVHPCPCGAPDALCIEVLRGRVDVTFAERSAA